MIDVDALTIPDVNEQAKANARIAKAIRIAEVGGRQVLRHEIQSTWRFTPSQGPNRHERRKARKLGKSETDSQA